MNKGEMGKKMAQIIAKAWADDAFKQKLLADAVGTLKKEGIEVPAGVDVRVVENTDKVFHLMLPPKPTSAELSDEALTRVSAGVDGGWVCCVCGTCGGTCIVNCY